MQVRVYYEDTDAGGVVYHAAYLGFFERARTEFLRRRGASVAQLHAEGFIFPVVRVEIDFRSPARLDDLLRIDTTVVAAGRSSFTLLQRALRAADDRLLAEAKVTLVCVTTGMKARRLPAPLFALLTAADD